MSTKATYFMNCVVGIPQIKESVKRSAQNYCLALRKITTGYLRCAFTVSFLTLSRLTKKAKKPAKSQIKIPQNKKNLLIRLISIESYPNQFTTFDG